MDKLHKEVATERYEMIINHILKGNLPVSHHVKVMLQDSSDDFYLFEAHCTCGWWDHWDERVSDW